MKSVEELTSNARKDPRLSNLDPPLGYPPCAGCRLCCTNQGREGVPLNLAAGDDPVSYKGATFRAGVWRLPVAENGNCAFLGPTGCTIHERAPSVCRVFDCRAAYILRNDPPRTPKHSPVVQHGKELLRRKKHETSNG
jgi:hypothetical protein